ncbi:Ypt Rab-specific GTPase-activating GYP6 [Olea europaea subsp. europaea]|uniref:Ypt Rab-specific GTPase-activating GYP6 n=1 Tax=Olea europaea subsp. europaea TaxID=158383 RepID=A0A8S0QTU7_OLEEU|nr:Ypt Rab-specific GTPase-activating GYP6 [Olea europaea subsp. europaea]
MPDTESCCENSRRFGDLRGLQWRINLGILPSSPSASIDDLRCVTANFRRRYAALRRQLLVDPQISKDGSNSPDLVMDNPLSQNPDSMWGRFFRNAELERMVDQDLTRLYPERGSYFQTTRCQGMLRRILLLWCIRHQQYGYRQGMHELLAPLLYVLNVDLERISEARKAYEDQFTENFDGFSFHENDLTYKFEFKKFSEYAEDGTGKEKVSVKASSLSELDSMTQTIALLSDAYGAEGELGIVVSEKFMEHDAYSMFDALMSGAGGAVAMADFFSTPFGTSHNVFPPVIEASSALYHLLSVVDLPLHNHLVELGIEPQYFALRWLRLLFGREFSLEILLVIWDEIFSRENNIFKKPADNDAESNFGVLDSPRGAFISAMAVSMILYLRSSLLASENATTCLQRLLNFPDDVNLVKLTEKAKSLQILAVDENNSTSLSYHQWLHEGSKLGITRAHSLSLDSTSPRTPLNIVPESYWEEKWRVFHKEEDNKQHDVEKQVPNHRKGWSEKVRLRLSRTESDPSPSKVDRKKAPKPSVRRNLLEDLVQQLGLDEDADIIQCNEDINYDPVEVNRQDVTQDSESAESEEISLNFSDSPSPTHGVNDHGNESESSVGSNLCIDENDPESNNSESCGTNPECSPLPVSNSRDVTALKCAQNDDSVRKSATDMKERKLLSGTLQWLWKFGRNKSEETSKVAAASEDEKALNGQSGQSNVADSTADGCDSSSGTCSEEAVDRNLMLNFRNLGQSMLENIQVPISHNTLPLIMN